jgi:hypothetical protein
MSGKLQSMLTERVDREVRFDSGTAVYAQEGSNFRQVPIGAGGTGRTAVHLAQLLEKMMTQHEPSRRPAAGA